MITKKYITQLSYEIVGCAIDVHKKLGPGLLESVYQKCLKYAVQKKGHSVIQQVCVPVVYEEVEIISELRLDLLVNELIVIELKTVENILPVHEAQLLTYMKLLKKPQGLLINFYTDHLTKSLRPMVNEHFRALPD